MLSFEQPFVFENILTAVIFLFKTWLEMTILFTEAERRKKLFDGKKERLRENTRQKLTVL